MKYIVSGILLVLVFVIGLAFSAHNEVVVEVNYFLAKGHFRLVHVIALAFLFGVLLCLCFSLFFYIKLRIHNRYLLARLKKLGLQNEHLRTDVAQNKLSKPEKLYIKAEQA